MTSKPEKKGGGEATMSASKTITELKDVSRIIKKRVESIEEKSYIFDKIKEDRYPRLRQHEVNISFLLGTGTFCAVNEITSFRIERPLEKNRYEQEEADRRFLLSHCIRSGDARYAIKRLKREAKDDIGTYLRGAVDLALEARFLAVVHHPHIIRMRAIADCDPYGESFFIVLDRLYCTLDERMEEWKTKQRLQKISSIITFGRGCSGNKLLLKKLVAAYQIARALSYFHQLNIIYRDLKPENIGFDVRGDIKIFDLGFAKEIRREEMLPDGTFKLTGRIGSLRYMAPEVVKSEPYTFTADVYSFGILLWEIISSERSFRGHSEDMHFDLVVNKGQRPVINKHFPESLGLLVSICWSNDLHKRSDFTCILESLSREIKSLKESEGVLLDFSSKTNRSN